MSAHSAIVIPAERTENVVNLAPILATSDVPRLSLEQLTPDVLALLAPLVFPAEDADAVVPHVHDAQEGLVIHVVGASQSNKHIPLVVREGDVCPSTSVAGAILIGSRGDEIGVAIRYEGENVMLDAPPRPSDYSLLFINCATG